MLNQLRGLQWLVWGYNRNGDELNAWVKGPAWNNVKLGFEDETETDMEMVGKIYVSKRTSVSRS